MSQRHEFSPPTNLLCSTFTTTALTFIHKQILEAVHKPRVERHASIMRTSDLHNDVRDSRVSQIVHILLVKLLLKAENMCSIS